MRDGLWSGSIAIGRIRLIYVVAIQENPNYTNRKYIQSWFHTDMMLVQIWFGVPMKAYAPVQS